MFFTFSLVLVGIVLVQSRRGAGLGKAEEKGFVHGRAACVYGFDIESWRTLYISDGADSVHVAECAVSSVPFDR